MKSILFFLLISVVLFSIVKTEVTDDVTHGCIINEETSSCCWMNNTPCCSPLEQKQLCYPIKTLCCKRRNFNKKTEKYYYIYYQHSRP